jgi:hypothetical protein
MLTDDEYDAMWSLAYPLPPPVRDAFLAAVSSALNGTATVGPGLAHRTARALLPRFFTPPEPDNGPNHTYQSRRRA